MRHSNYSPPDDDYAFIAEPDEYAFITDYIIQYIKYSDQLIILRKEKEEKETKLIEAKRKSTYSQLYNKMPIDAIIQKIDNSEW